MAASSASPATILVTGATGQVGHELVRSLAPLGRVIAPGRAELDLADEASIRSVMRSLRPSLVVNPGAYTAVDRAEAEPEVSAAVNAAAPRILAEEAARAGGALIHYSTDYVFDGSSADPYSEDDPTAPVSVYGRTKLEGEQAIAGTGVPHLILRTSWVYGRHGGNFMRTMLRLAREREEIRVVADQAGAPTWSRGIASATAAMISRLASRDVELPDAMRQVSGVYHLTASGRTTWHGFAEAVLALDPARHEQRCRRVVPITTADYPTPARRPANSVLLSERAEQVFGVRIPDWREQLALALSA